MGKGIKVKKTVKYNQRKGRKSIVIRKMKVVLEPYYQFRLCSNIFALQK